MPCLKNKKIVNFLKYFKCIDTFLWDSTEKSRENISFNVLLADVSSWFANYRRKNAEKSDISASWQPDK